MRQVSYPFKATGEHALFIYQFMSSDNRQKSKGL